MNDDTQQPQQSIPADSGNSSVVSPDPVADDANQSVTPPTDPADTPMVDPLAAEPDQSTMLGNSDDTVQTFNEDPTTDAAQLSVPTNFGDTPVALADFAKDTTKADASGEPKKSPLDVLEELLNEVGDKNGKPGLDKVDTKPAGPTEEEIKAQELEQKRIEYEQKKKEQEIIDAQLIQQQQAAMLSLNQTDAQKARDEQDAQKADEAQQKKSAGEGYEIDQLDHTKV